MRFRFHWRFAVDALVLPPQTSVVMSLAKIARAGLLEAPAAEQHFARQHVDTVMHVKLFEGSDQTLCQT